MLLFVLHSSWQVSKAASQLSRLGPVAVAQKSQTTAMLDQWGTALARSLVLLYQTNLTKNPLNHFEEHIGSVPARSHTPFKGHNLYKEITRAWKTKTKWVAALNGPCPRDWDCYFGTQNRKFNLYLHKHAKHKQSVSNQTNKQPWCWPTKSLYTHLNTAQANLQLWTPSTLGDQAMFKLASTKGSARVPSVNTQLFSSCTD